MYVSQGKAVQNAYIYIQSKQSKYTKLSLVKGSVQTMQLFHDVLFMEPMSKHVDDWGWDSLDF